MHPARLPPAAALERAFDGRLMVDSPDASEEDQGAPEGNAVTDQQTEKKWKRNIQFSLMRVEKMVFT